MSLVGAGPGVQHHDRVGIEILSLAHFDGEIGRRIADRDVQESAVGIEGERRPGPAAADGEPGRVFPGRIVERRGP